MGPILGSLVNLQSIERSLRKVRQRRKKSKQTVLFQERQIEQLKASLDAKREEIKLTRLQFSRLELELQGKEADISKMRVALNTAKTNKDYSVILTRINTDKADKAKLEDQILGLMTQIEADQSSCQEIEVGIVTEQQRLEEIRAEARQKASVIQAELDALESQRSEATKQVPPKELTQFERLAVRFDGEVLAEVSKRNGPRGDSTCGGCYMKVTLEVVNSLMTKDEALACNNCGRILVLDANPKQQATA